MVVVRDLLQLQLWKMYKQFGVQNFIQEVNYMQWVQIQKHYEYALIQNLLMSGNSNHLFCEQLLLNTFDSRVLFRWLKIWCSNCWNNSVLFDYKVPTHNNSHSYTLPTHIPHSPHSYTLPRPISFSWWDFPHIVIFTALPLCTIILPRLLLIQLCF